MRGAYVSLRGYGYVCSPASSRGHHGSALPHRVRRRSDIDEEARLVDPEVYFILLSTAELLDDLLDEVYAGAWVAGSLHHDR